MKPNDILTEQQLDELQWAKDLANAARGATQKVKGAYDDISDAGQAVGGLVGQAVGRPVKGAYDLAKRGVTGALKGAGTVAGDVSKGVGAVAGAPEGMFRAGKSGYKAGADYVAGDGQDQQATAQDQAVQGGGQAQTANVSAGDKTKINDINNQIAQKQADIQRLQQQLSTIQSQAGAEGPGLGQKVANALSGAAKGAGGAIDSAVDAMKRGKGMGASGVSLAPQSKSPSGDDTHEVRDENGVPHKYKKVGGKWYDEAGKPLDKATSAMIQNQKAGAPAVAAPTKPAGKQLPGGQNAVDVGEPTSTGGAKFTTPSGVVHKAAAANPNAQQTGGASAGQLPASSSTLAAPQTQASAFAQKPTQYQQATYNVPSGVPQVGGASQATAATPANATAPQARPTLTPVQQKAQAATLARMQGQRNAGKSMATSTSQGMKNSVNAAREKGLTTAESVEFGNILWKQLHS